MRNKNTKLKLINEYATREKMQVFDRLFSALPDPDKILQNNNYDYNIYRDLLLDPHLTAAVQQRKMQVMQMGWEIDYEGDDNIKRKTIDLVRNLPLPYIISDILDSIFFGFSIMEIEWKIKDDEIVPVSLVGKPQEWFIFNRKNEIRLRKRMNGFYLFEEGKKLPEYKFILSQNKPTYVNPYGERILSRCYWPVVFKRAGVEYWQLMMERYGMPYLIGRYNTGATESEKAELLDQLKQMVEDTITVMETGVTIEIKESPKYEVGGLYEKIVEFQNNEISKAVLTVTLTTDLKKIGSYKAAQIHKDMLSFIGIADKKLVEKALNTLFEYYCKLNFDEGKAPKIKLNKKEAIIEHTAARDKILKEIGVRFTKEYFKKKYNLSDSDFELNREETNG